MCLEEREVSSEETGAREYSKYPGKNYWLTCKKLVRSTQDEEETALKYDRDL